MSAALRSILGRISPLFWLAAIALVIAYDADHRIHVLGWVIICTGLGAAGTVSGTISAAAGYDRALLLNALAANRPPPAEAEPDAPAPDLHAV